VDKITPQNFSEGYYPVLMLAIVCSTRPRATLTGAIYYALSAN